MIREYIHEYNEIRPHESLGNRTPSEAFSDCFLIA
ncbi:MAG: integrase core domain-containing protein [Oscillospiraceae bacterium]|nr:integrase core domain-containing protein [Oscillospiraceae bacterium]